MRPKGLKYKKHKDNPTSFKEGTIPWNKGLKGSQVAWNKGLTKETDERIKNYASTLSERGIRPPCECRNHENISNSKKGDKNPAKRKEVREKIKSSVIRWWKDNPDISRRASGINQYSNSFTSIERLIADELSSRNILFIHNHIPETIPGKIPINYLDLK